MVTHQHDTELQSSAILGYIWRKDRHLLRLIKLTGEISALTSGMMFV